MIRCQHQHQRIAIRAAALRRQRGEGDGRGGIASGRFKNDVFGQLVQLSQLLGDDKAVLFITDHHRAFAIYAIKAVYRGLQHGELPFQAEELFWIEHAGEWP